MPDSRAMKITKSIAGHTSLILVSCAFLLPFAWLVLTSVKPDNQIFEFPPSWIPNVFQWQNYPDALEYIPFWRYTLNTLFVAISGTFGTIVSCSLVAYGFSIVKWRWANILFIVMLSTMMLPPQVTMIPVFMIFKKLAWVGTFRPLIIPAFFANAWSVFLLRQFFKTVPKGLMDAAKIDGCSHFDVYWRIVLPLSKPALAVIAFFSFTYFWNDFMGPMIYLNDDVKYTLSLGLQQFFGQHGAKWGMLMAASTMMIMPIIVLFFLLQKTFVEGINLTGLKG